MTKNEQLDKLIDKLIIYAKTTYYYDDLEGFLDVYKNEKLVRKKLKEVLSTYTGVQGVIRCLSSDLKSFMKNSTYFREASYLYLEFNQYLNKLEYNVNKEKDL